MKRLLTFALGLAVLASCNGVKWTLTETEYGYNVMTQKKGRTIAYSPESGISILTVDGYAFKDFNRNGELDVYEDWRLGAEERAENLAAQLTIEEIAGMMLYSSHQSVPSAGGMFAQGPIREAASVGVIEPPASAKPEKFISGASR